MKTKAPLFYTLFICVLFTGKISFSQDSIAKETKQNQLRFSINAVQLLINEVSIYVDYPYHKKQSFGINAGYVFHDIALQRDFNLINEIEHPTTAYNGLVTRFYYKLYFREMRRAYLETQLDYKYVSYNSQTFSAGIQNIVYKTVRSENASQIGIDLIYGVHLSDFESKLNIELFFSAGYRYRLRHISTESNLIGGTVYNPYNYPDFYPVGITHQAQIFPMFTIGLKIGMNIFY